ncbi:MAG: hypothetical protein A4E28_01253 [Methanocella sp. PtaU1.Bin125]|nr:MAG: hypothetical protein A4E28_01253 [Methanocella sp. PtaU1.Bin125]
MSSAIDWVACPGRVAIAALVVAVLGIAVTAGMAGAQWSDVYVWEKVYGGAGEVDVATDVRQAPDGGFIVGGYVGKKDGSSEAYLLKINGQGEKVWDKRFGEGTTNEFYCVLPVDGGYLCVGGTNEETGRGNDIYLVKVSSSGNEVWSKTYGTALTDFASKIIPASDGGYIVLGRTQRTDKRGFDAYLLKVNSNGNQVWDSRITNQSHDSCSDIKATADGGYVIAGIQKRLEGRPDDAYLLKTDSSGKKVWEQVYGGTYYDKGFAVAEVEGGYLLMGETTSYGNGTLGDFWLVRTDGAGKELWNATYGDKGWEDASSVMLKMPDGGFLICGGTTSIGNGNLDCYLLKVDRDGRFMWDAAYGTGSYERASSVVRATDGSYVIAGVQQKTGNMDDIYLVRTNGGPGLNSHLNWGGQADDSGAGGDQGNSGDSGNDGDSGSGKKSGGILQAIIDLIKSLFGL